MPPPARGCLPSGRRGSSDCRVRISTATIQSYGYTDFNIGDSGRHHRHRRQHFSRTSRHTGQLDRSSDPLYMGTGRYAAQDTHHLGCRRSYCLYSRLCGADVVHQGHRRKQICRTRSHSRPHPRHHIHPDRNDPRFIPRSTYIRMVL